MISFRFRRFPVFLLSILLPLLFLCAVPGLLNAEDVQFAYSHSGGDKWHLTSEVNEDVLMDGQLLYNSEILNKIEVEVREGEGEEGLLWNRYHIAEMAPESEVYAWSGNFEVEYRRDTRGILSDIPAGSIVPTVRNIPVFPDEPTAPGGRWEAAGTEVFDLEPSLGIPEILKIDFNAEYEYAGQEAAGKTSGEEADEEAGEESDKERLFDVIKIEYQYRWSPDEETLKRLQEYPVFPVQITGTFYQKVFWDAAVGRNYAEEGIFGYTYRMNDGHFYTFQGTSRGKAVYAKPMDKVSLLEEVEKLNQENIWAEVVEDGVKLSLENINFYPDSAVMLPEQDDKLTGMLDILARNPERDIRVVGHTAYIPGLGDGQKLSEERAETVARYIIDSGVRSRESVVIRGMGNREPIAGNETEQGRRKNRRVEIIILEN